MRNSVISYIFGGFEVFLKIPVIIIIDFVKIMLGPIYIFQFLRWADGLERWGMQGLTSICCLLFIKTEKLLEHDLS